MPVRSLTEKEPVRGHMQDAASGGLRLESRLARCSPGEPGRLESARPDPDSRGL